MSQIPDCSQIFANEYGTTVYIKPKFSIRP